MSTIDCGSIDEFLRRFPRDMKARERRVKTAIKSTTRSGVGIVRKNVPKAFGGLQSSIHAEIQGDAGLIIADAPHAAAIENGSRPHFPPLEPLVAWVKLRGMQAIAGVKKSDGPTAQGHANMVGLALKGFEHTTEPKYKRRGRYLSVDAPTQIARVIQLSIGRNGTKPYYYMGQSVPEISALLEVRVFQALRDDSTSGAYSPI